MATPSSKRRPSVGENASAAGVCLVLGLMAAWLLHVQAHLSPAVSIAFGNLKTPAASSQVREPVPDVVPQWPASLQAMSAAESFTAATLSDKIDGKAEVYLTAGVVGLWCRRLSIHASPSSWLELFVFDMGKPANAFSVFSSQKRSDVTDIRLADYAYRAGNELAFVHGRFYVEVVATDEAPATIEAATALAKAYIAATAVKAHADVSADQALFPPDGLVTGSVELLSADVFGFDGLKDVYVAHYRDGGSELTLFVARRATAGDATAADAALLGFFVNDCGGKEAARPTSPPGAVIVDSGGSFDGVFTSGRFLAGVHQAPSGESAARWLKLLDGNLASKQ